MSAWIAHSVSYLRRIVMNGKFSLKTLAVLLVFAVIFVPSLFAGGQRGGGGGGI
jgi:hypothetical protein